MLMYFLIFLVVLCGAHGKYTANIVFIERENSTSNLSREKSGPAVDIAVVKVQEKYNDSIDFNVIFVNHRECSPLYIGVYASKIFYSTNVSVFIGPACNEALEPLTYMALTWNVAILTPLGNSGIFNDELFTVVTRLSAWTLIFFAKFTHAILRHYNWTYFSLIYDSTQGFATTSGITFTQYFQSAEINSQFFWNNLKVNPNEMTDEDVEDILTRASVNSRVIVLYLRRLQIRRFMLIAKDLGFTNGDFVFLTGASSSGVAENWWKIGDDQDEVAKEIYKTVFCITVMVDLSPTYSKFQDEVMNRSRQHYGYDFTSQPSVLLAGYHDAIMVYAQALNETLALGEDPADGNLLSSRMWNRTYEGIAGNFTIGARGFRNGNLGLQQVDNDGKFRVVATYDVDGDVYVEEPDAKILWINNKGPPRNIPLCGFKNDKCPSGVNDAVIYGVGFSLGVVLLAALIIIPLLHRRWKQQSEVDKLWWKIDKKDLVYENSSTCRSTLSMMSKVSAMNINQEQWEVALFKGNAIRIRKLVLTSANVLTSSQIVQEFKLVRDLNCSNLCRVIGGCLEMVPEVLLISEHCPKGSLQDLLGNSSFSLDAQFKFSLAIDISEGMCFLTESSIGCHGNLTSAVCLIDNRFSVKITDFGLPSIFNNEKKDRSTQEYKTDCLWKAPEILRSSKPKGSKEGDLYSFGVILYEILTRDPPYCEEVDVLGISVVLEKIKDKKQPVFRPKLHVPPKMSELGNLIKECLEEDPTSRPSFAYIKKSLKAQTNRFGGSVNLLDNLLRRMELYANNLEKLVEDKTQELVEEKKRSEQLLYEILPRSVAESLKLGLPVEPEAFECVTIYFSDIVGFTEISARSSPLQVVELLNHLYSCFDAIVGSMDVYKVETIGDAYMVVCGLPEINENHAKEIAIMSLSLREAIHTIDVKHLPDVTLQLRIGIHTGSTVAGVVGLKMPRYCLFGDTVNTASRMESSGEAMKIHISNASRQELEKYEQFNIIPRGEINVKGKGSMRTFWLERLAD